MIISRANLILKFFLRLYQLKYKGLIILINPLNQTATKMLFQYFQLISMYFLDYTNTGFYFKRTFSHNSYKYTFINAFTVLEA